VFCFVTFQRKYNENEEKFILSDNLAQKRHKRIGYAKLSLFVMDLGFNNTEFMLLLPHKK